VTVCKPVELDSAEERSSEVTKETTFEHSSAGFVDETAAGKRILDIGGSSESPGPGDNLSMAKELDSKLEK